MVTQTLAVEAAAEPLPMEEWVSEETHLETGTGQTAPMGEPVCTDYGASLLKNLGIEWSPRHVNPTDYPRYKFRFRMFETALERHAGLYQLTATHDPSRSRLAASLQGITGFANGY